MVGGPNVVIQKGGLEVEFSHSKGVWTAVISLERRELLSPHVVVRPLPGSSTLYTVEVSRRKSAPPHKQWQVEGTLDGARNFAIQLIRNYLFGTPVRTG